MNKRYIGALTLIPLLGLIFLGGYFLKVTTLFLAARGLFEFYHVIMKKGHHPVKSLGYGALMIYYVLLIFNEDPLRHLAVIVAMATTLGFVIMVFSEKYSITDISITVMGFVYTGVMFGFLILLEGVQGGIYLVYSVFVISWVCDTMAYYTGRAFGKHKLIERVSPKKTIEGAVGGLVGGALGAFVLGYVVLPYTGIEPWKLLIMGFFGAMFGQIGDLAASSIKRYAEEKDYPKLIPGHGGILDRFDSILFVALFVYAYVMYLI